MIQTTIKGKTLVGPGMCDHCGTVARALDPANVNIPLSQCDCLCHQVRAAYADEWAPKVKVKKIPKAKATSKGLKLLKPAKKGKK